MRSITEFINEQMINESSFKLKDLQTFDIVKLRCGLYRMYFGPEKADVIEKLTTWSTLKRVNYTKKGALLLLDKPDVRPCHADDVWNGMKMDLTNRRGSDYDIVEVRRPKLDESEFLERVEDGKRGVYEFLADYVPTLPPGSLMSTPMSSLSLDKVRFVSPIVWSEED